MTEIMLGTKLPESGNVYTPSLPALEALPAARELEREVFGCVPAQFGFCNGHTHSLGALEWHECPEINLAVTPLVLLLALRQDIVGGRVDSAKARAFYLPEGTAAVIYPGTLHFAPCAVGDEGFRCMVGLAKGTNLPLERPVPGGCLRAVNKWLLCHAERRDLIDSGACEGIDGENTVLVY